MKIITCCNDRGDLMPFGRGTVFFCFEIDDLSVSGFNYEARTEIKLGEGADTDEKICILKDNNCTLFLCGRVGCDEEEALDRSRLIFLPGCLGPVDLAVRTFLSGGNPAGTSCGGECSSCAGSCDCGDANNNQ